jgi:hypothetical protein
VSACVHGQAFGPREIPALFCLIRCSESFLSDRLPASVLATLGRGRVEGQDSMVPASLPCINEEVMVLADGSDSPSRTRMCVVLFRSQNSIPVTARCLLLPLRAGGQGRGRTRSCAGAWGRDPRRRGASGPRAPGATGRELLTPHAPRRIKAASKMGEAGPRRRGVSGPRAPRGPPRSPRPRCSRPSLPGPDTAVFGG